MAADSISAATNKKQDFGTSPGSFSVQGTPLTRVCGRAGRGVSSLGYSGNRPTTGPVRAENLNPDVLVMQPANQGV